MTLLLCKLWPYIFGGLIGWLLAGLLARRFKYVEPPLHKVVEKRVEIDNPKHLTLIKKLEAENKELSGFRKKLSLYEGQNDLKITDQNKTSLTSSKANTYEVDFNKAKAAGFNLRRKGDQDDFTVIDGIGPQINELIHAGNIHTFRILASTNTNTIKSILDKAGPSFKLADPEKWPIQAELAANNEWEKLMKWQDELDRGKPE